MKATEVVFSLCFILLAVHQVIGASTPIPWVPYPYFIAGTYEMI
jgi:hypothetical protein